MDKDKQLIFKNFPVDIISERIEQSAKIYGLILFTDEHPFMKKVLRDDDYWRALDKLSGEKFAIFSIKPLSGKLENTSINKKVKGVDYLVPIWKEPEENKVLMEALGIMDSSNLPTFIIFTEIDSQFIYAGYTIENKSIEGVYKSIRSIVEISKKTIENFKPEYLTNSKSLYRELSGNLNYNFTWKKVVNTLDFVKTIKSYLNII